MSINFRIIFSVLIFVFGTFYNIEAQNKQFNYNSVSDNQKKIIFKEDFNSNKNGWPVFKNKQKAAQISGGKYILAAKEAGFHVSPKNVKKKYPKNFDFELSLKFNKGSERVLYYILLNQHVKSNPSRKRQLATAEKLKRAYKPNQFNKITLRKINNAYIFYLNEQFIKKSSADKLPTDKIRLSVAKNSILSIDKIVVSQLFLNDITDNEKVKSEIIIYSPKTERGFVQIKNTDLSNLQDSNITIDGKIEPFVTYAKFFINEVPVLLSANGAFRSNYNLKEGKNTINFKLTQNNTLITTKQIIINYETEKSNKTISNPIINTNDKRLALVIGNADYQFGGVLANPENDAKSMAAALKQIGFDVLEYTNANQKEIKKAIDEFGDKLKLYDVGLFFYAGHGVQVKGSNYLVPVDANLSSENDVEYDCVNAERILAKMEDAGSKVNIVVLDACRNNPFERSWTRSTQGKGLAFMNAPSGSLIAYATSPGTTASDGSGQNGLYTSALLQHLSTPNITILEMFQQVRSTVMEKSGDIQVPWESTSLKGNFYFVK